MSSKVEIKNYTPKLLNVKKGIITILKSKIDTYEKRNQKALPFFINPF